MNAEVFVDTNVFLYSISDKPEEETKSARARLLLLTQDWGWSVQVAGEFFHTATSHKRQFRIAHSAAAEYVRTWLNFPTASLDRSTVLEALEIQQRFQLSYWDAAIIAAARSLGCHTVFTEDLNHGQDYSGVIAVNPFLVTAPI
jgi:predicted nucleic acid-binding protein